MTVGDLNICMEMFDRAGHILHYIIYSDVVTPNWVGSRLVEVDMEARHLPKNIQNLFDCVNLLSDWINKNSSVVGIKAYSKFGRLGCHWGD